MNPVDYLSSVKNLLLNSPLIIGHQIIREYEGLQKSYIRARITLTDGSVLEFSEYNTPHFPKLKHFPHHIHIKEDDVISGKPIDIFGVLAEIERMTKKQPSNAG